MALYLFVDYLSPSRLIISSPQKFCVISLGHPARASWYWMPKKKTISRAPTNLYFQVIPNSKHDYKIRNVTTDKKSPDQIRHTGKKMCQAPKRI